MSYQNWIIIAGFSVVNLIGFSLLLFTISKIPVVEYQLIGVLTPIISGIFAYLILNEVITAKHLLGLAFMSVGLFIALKK